MVYEIQKYAMVDKTIVVYQERPDLTVKTTEDGQDKFFDKDGDRVESNRYRMFTQSLDIFVGFENAPLFNRDEYPEFLPYFADVTEDLPSRLRIEPKTYKGCQLLTQKHGGYLEFYHHETEKTLRIALNSNIYTPVK